MKWFTISLMAQSMLGKIIHSYISGGGSPRHQLLENSALLSIYFYQLILCFLDDELMLCISVCIYICLQPTIFSDVYHCLCSPHTFYAPKFQHKWYHEIYPMSIIVFTFYIQMKGFCSDPLLNSAFLYV